MGWQTVGGGGWRAGWEMLSSVGLYWQPVAGAIRRRDGWDRMLSSVGLCSVLECEYKL